MRTRRWFFLIVVLLVLVVGAVRWLRSQGYQSGQDIAPASKEGRLGFEEPLVEALVPPAADRTGVDQGRVTARPSEDVDSKELMLPTLDQLRAEVAKNPHGTPAVLVEFARGLAPRMEEALGSDDPNVVRRMVFFLKGCALSDSPQAVAQVQAQCLRNFERLAEKKQGLLPTLGSEWEETLRAAADEPKRLLRSLKKLQEM